MKTNIKGKEFVGWWNLIYKKINIRIKKVIYIYVHMYMYDKWGTIYILYNKKNPSRPMVPFLLTTKIASISPSFSKKNSLFIFFFLFLLHLHFRFCFLLLTIPPKIHLRPSAAAIVIRFVFLNVIVVLIK